MCGSLLGRSKARKASEKQAALTVKSAKLEAAAAAEAVRGNQIAREATLAQATAADAAATLLDVPMEQVEVDLAPTPDAEIDPATGRRRPTRAAFQSGGRAQSGLRIF